MPLIVQKFGGSSVADADRIRRCAQRVYDARRAGSDVVVVVSAMGKTTDRLIELSKEIADSPSKREMDQLLATGEQVTIALMAMALQSLGQDSVSLTGAQCGIVTEAAFTRAKVRSIDCARIHEHLKRGRVPVVAGFQGMTESGETTTLGRGGSDTTAVALAAALKADVCDIFTDVDGVYTADPRVVPNARKLSRISFEEMLELASLGAKVMAARSMLLGMKFGVPIHVRHAQLPDEGTMIVQETPEMEQDLITGVALKTNLGRITLTDLPNRPDVQSRLFSAIAEAGCLVDDIIQDEPVQDRIGLSFTMDHGELADVRPVLDRVLGELGGGQVKIDVGLCRVAAVGVGMRHHTGVAARMFRALAEAPGGPVRIENITTSEIKISCILPKEDGERALRTVHDAFKLSEAKLPEDLKVITRVGAAAQAR